MATTMILAVGSIRAGVTHWHVTPPATLEPASTPAPPAGELQRAIDYGAELAELEDDMIDRMFWSRGEW